MSAVPDRDEALELKALTVTTCLPPRLGRRLKCMAHSEGRSVERMASLILARGLVPDARERRRLVGLDLDDALGVDRHDVVVVGEQV